MKLQIFKAGNLMIYRFARADGAIFSVVRVLGGYWSVGCNKKGALPFCLPAKIKMAEIVGIMQNLKIDANYNRQAQNLDCL